MTLCTGANRPCICHLWFVLTMLQLANFPISPLLTLSLSYSLLTLSFSLFLSHSLPLSLSFSPYRMFLDRVVLRPPVCQLQVTKCTKHPVLKVVVGTVVKTLRCQDGGSREGAHNSRVWPRPEGPTRKRPCQWKQSSARFCFSVLCLRCDLPKGASQTLRNMNHKS